MTVRCSRCITTDPLPDGSVTSEHRASPGIRRARSALRYRRRDDRWVQVDPGAPPGHPSQGPPGDPQDTPLPRVPPGPPRTGPREAPPGPLDGGWSGGPARAAPDPGSRGRGRPGPGARGRAAGARGRGAPRPGPRDPLPGPGPGGRSGPGRGGSAAAPPGPPVPRPRRSPQEPYYSSMVGKMALQDPLPGPPVQAPTGGLPGPPPGGAQDPGPRGPSRDPKNAHFFGYLITLPVGTDFAPRDFGTKSGTGGSGTAGGVQTGVPPPDPAGGTPVRNRPLGMLTRAVADRRAQWPLGPSQMLGYGWGLSAIRYRSRQHTSRSGVWWRAVLRCRSQPSGSESEWEALRRQDPRRRAERCGMQDVREVTCSTRDQTSRSAGR